MHDLSLLHGKRRKKSIVENVAESTRVSGHSILKGGQLFVEEDMSKHHIRERHWWLAETC